MGTHNDEIILGLGGIFERNSAEERLELVLGSRMDFSCGLWAMDASRLETKLIDGWPVSSVEGQESSD